MSHSLTDQFQKYWQAARFCPPDGIVLLACSGGVDSMALAHLLLAADVRLAVAHCNFNLRGDAANADELHVRNWAHAHNLPFFSVSFDTHSVATLRREGIQQTARDLRYQWLESVRSGNGFSCIATAHHRDDVAETVLINLMRGCGIAGLHGIRERNGSVIRPLLFASRSSILEYARHEGISWREDASNQSNDYTRNAIRNIILPEMEKILPQAGDQIAATAGRIAAAEVLYAEAIELRRRKLLEQRGRDWYIPVRKLLKEPVRETILFELLRPYGFSAAQAAGALRLLSSDSGRSISSATHRLIRNRDFLIITAQAPQSSDFIPVDAAPATIALPAHSVSFSYVSKPADLQSPPAVAFLNADALEWPLILRPRRTGDYFYPIGMKGKKKKLGRFLNDLKLPAHQKEQVWVLESNRRIVWALGLRLDERFKVTDATTSVLRVELHSVV